MSTDGNGPLGDQRETISDLTGDIQSVLNRPGEHPLKRWFLLEGRRAVISLTLVVVVFLTLMGLSALRPGSVLELMSETNTVRTVFNTLLSGVILLVSIVVSINSVILSQEITDIENQQERTTASLEFRKRIEDAIHADVTPARPAEFIRVVLYTILRKTNHLEEVAEATDDEEFQEHVGALETKVSDDVDQARAILGNAKFGTFKVLLAGLNYDYSGQLHAARYLRRKYGQDLSEEEQRAIDELIDSLVFFTTGKEYFKSLYYKRELAKLSARLLYVSLPVIVFISYVLLAVDANQFPDAAVLGLPPLILFVSLGYAIALTPYVVLTSYIVRVATVSLRTLAAGPFILQRGNQAEALDIEEYDDEIQWESEISAGD